MVFRPGKFRNGFALKDILLPIFDNRAGSSYRSSHRIPGARRKFAIGQVRTFANRIAIGTRKGRLEILDRVWVTGTMEPIPVGPRSRGVDVLALRRENKLYPQNLQSSIVDAALELVEPLDTGLTGPPSRVVGRRSKHF